MWRCPLNIYSHVTPGLGQHAAEPMRELLGEGEGQAADEHQERGGEVEE